MTTPDIGIQTNFINKTNMPPLDADGFYYVRYRVKTLDGATTTQWSPLHKISKETITYRFGGGGNYEVISEAKSHGKSIDFSWLVRHKTTKVVGPPEEVKDLPLDVYVRWGGKIVSFSYAGTVCTISLNFDHKFVADQDIYVSLPGGGDSLSSKFTVKEIIDARTITVETVGAYTGFIDVDNLLFGSWIHSRMTYDSSLSLTIPNNFETLMENVGTEMAPEYALQTRYSQFLVHLASTSKTKTENDSNTRILFTTPSSTAASYDSGSIV